MSSCVGRRMLSLKLDRIYGGEILDFKVKLIVVIIFADDFDWYFNMIWVVVELHIIFLIDSKVRWVRKKTYFDLFHFFIFFIPSRSLNSRCCCFSSYSFWFSTTSKQASSVVPSIKERREKKTAKQKQNKSSNERQQQRDMLSLISSNIIFIVK